ncbi:molybdopterin molybdotransferase MoeA [Rhodomicrobium vannielii ATCC 17100]|uniref:molybdopterin molybdotransferase MoeA n=1 Tax=Rhodomicrobium vannielii TaxID=1069 RepID=UPI00191873BD|nr:gephyrin-like molybdotransferase Glp [Rhodomicrobium vannielii]MBJ7534719.1 molybdopterin molybdotransferase MoeA [Rhodomicrobium vannielii ATCC 17100]
MPQPIPVDEALAKILADVEPVTAEIVSLLDAGGRVLAVDLAAKLTQPPFDASAMDGYAVRVADIAAAPARLAVIGEAAAGHGFAGTVGEGQAARIFTGAPVPVGADAVVVQEAAREAGGVVTVLEVVPPGAHIRRRGYDFREGQTMIGAGETLNARKIMLAAAMNYGSLSVRRRPVVAVLATGDELAEPGTDLLAGQIVSSVPAGLSAAVAAWGGEPSRLAIARDTRESLAAAISAARDADILVTIGGASVGAHDLVQGALEAAGAKFEVMRVAMRPGKPLMSGCLGRQRVLSLPGNPVAALVCARLFLKPLLDRMIGRASDITLDEAPLAAVLAANGPRQHYMRACREHGAVTPLGDQDSSLVSVFAAADCLIVLAPYAAALDAGSVVPIIPLDF